MGELSMLTTNTEWRNINCACAEVSLTFHSLSFVIRLTIGAQAAECIHKSYDVSAERIVYCNFQWFDD